MKMILSAMILFSGAFANAFPLEVTHWTLQGIECETGMSPVLPKTTRYDLHFIADSKFEIAVLRNDDWLIARGTFQTHDETGLCMNAEEIIMSGQEKLRAQNQWCGTYRQTAETFKFTWVVKSDGGGDCAPNVPATATFTRL